MIILCWELWSRAMMLCRSVCDNKHNNQPDKNLQTMANELRAETELKKKRNKQQLALLIAYYFNLTSSINSWLNLPSAFMPVLSIHTTPKCRFFHAGTSGDPGGMSGARTMVVLHRLMKLRNDFPTTCQNLERLRWKWGAGCNLSIGICNIKMFRKKWGFEWCELEFFTPKIELILNVWIKRVIFFRTD